MFIIFVLESMLLQVVQVVLLLVVLLLVGFCDAVILLKCLLSVLESEYVKYFFFFNFFYLFRHKISITLVSVLCLDRTKCCKSPSKNIPQKWIKHIYNSKSCTIMK